MAKNAYIETGVAVMQNRKKYAGLIMTLCMVVLLYGGSMTVVRAQSCVDVTQDQTLVDKFERFTVTGITTELPGPDPNPPGYIGPSYIQADDLDGDGRKEIVVTAGQGDSLNPWIVDGSVAVFKRTSEDLSTWTQSVIRADFAFPNDPLIRDVDGDGEVDIMVFDNFIAGNFTKQPAGIYLLKNLGGDITDPANWQKITIYAEDPDEVGIDTYERAKRRSCYHQGYFVDLDGDGREDFATTRVSMEVWQNMSGDPLIAGKQYMWTEWFRAENDLETYPTGFSGPYDIGDGIGFLMDMHDVDDDGLLDVIGPQFFIVNSGSLVVKGPGDQNGDSLVWFKNPRQAALAADPNYAWERITIDNWYTSPNPIGKGFQVFPADITNDDSDELIVTTHNHQEYVDGERIWPAGVYYLTIPDDPFDTANWNPVAIDAGDAYLVDRPGGPYEQGSPGFARVGDISGNGLSDLVVAGDGRGAVYYYEAGAQNETCLNFDRTALWDDPASMPANVQLFDLDGDGGLEIAANVYDTSFAKDNSAGSIFIWKLLPQAECAEDSDCSEGYACVEGVCTEVSCGLRIKPKRRKVRKFRGSAQRTFRIKGNKFEEGFDPYAEIDFGPFQINSTEVNNKGVLKVNVEVPAGVTLERGIFDVRVGSCVGEIEIK